MNRYLFLVLFSFLLYGCTNKTSSQKQFGSEPKIVVEMKEKITVDYLENIVNELMVSQFESIDSLSYRNSYSPEQRVKKLEFKKDKYDSCYSTFVFLQGYIYGQIKESSNQRYSFLISAKITDKNIDNPYLDFRKGLSIIDDNDVYVFDGGRNPDEATAYLKAIKESEKFEKNDSYESNDNDLQLKMNIDGLTLECIQSNSNSIWYKSNSKLNPEQIVKVINKIGKKRSNYIVFFVGDLDYASYVYYTQCIIYNETKEIYKIQNDKLIKMPKIGEN